jgi:putative phosphoesterase
VQKIGLISDTHGYIDRKFIEFFKDCHQIWHAGDIGSNEVIDKLKTNSTFVGVHGNIDDSDIRIEYPEIKRFKCEEIDILIIHIGGYPGNYTSKVKKEFLLKSPDLFISGHSHILKIIYDKKFDCLHINPGAAGNSGFHIVKTAIRFVIDKKEIKDLEILEIER